MSDVQVLTGDCLALLPTLEAESVDAVVTDPPYGETSLAWDVPVEAWLPLVRRVLKPSGSLWCFGSLRMFMEMDFTGWKFAQDIVWEKHNGSIFHADRFRRVHEHVLQFYPTDRLWGEVYKSPLRIADASVKRSQRRAPPPHHGGGLDNYVEYSGGSRFETSVLRVRSCHGYAQHPTQKPIGILTPLIEYSCPPNGVVLDPFGGSGSTGRAAKDTGRRAIIIEIDPEYCRIAEQRLAQEVLPLHTAQEHAS